MLTTDLDSVSLRWQGTGTVGAKLETTAEGVDVTGVMQANSIQVNSPLPITDVTNAYPITNLVNSSIASLSAGVFAGVQIGPTNYRARVNGTDGSIPSATFAFTQAKTVGVEEGAENGSYEIWVKKAGVDTNILQVEHLGIDVTGKIECDTSLQITSSGTDVDAMPDFYMTNIETAVAEQNLGMISFRGYNLATTPEITNYADVYAQQVVVTDGAEEGKLVFDVLGAGAKVEALTVTKDGIDVTGTIAANSLVVTDTDSSDRTKPEIRLKKDTLNSDGEAIGQIVFSGDDKWEADRVFAEIVAVAVEMPANEYQANNDAITGALHFNIANGVNSNNVETPACVIDTTGVHINSHVTDGTAGTNYFHIENINLAATKNGGIKYHSHTEGDASNKTTKLISKAVTQDATIELPNVTGTAVVAAIAGGSINGGGGTTGAKTTWSESDFNANVNTTYLHYNAVDTADLTVSPDYPDNGYGDFFKFVNASPQASDIIIDLDGYAGSSVTSYALTKTDGSLNVTVNTASASTIVVAPGGYVILTKVSLTVYMVEGIGYTYS